MRCWWLTWVWRRGTIAAYLQVIHEDDILGKGTRMTEMKPDAEVSGKLRQVHQLRKGEYLAFQENMLLNRVANVRGFQHGNFLQLVASGIVRRDVDNDIAGDLQSRSVESYYARLKLT
mmetsp:Transcript_18670/g.63598  ORF Transcript_18670/g.63598 Transcript_18670/m.63598 type:complete len:118 (+) Transcript_18670:101-454(+)